MNTLINETENDNFRLEIHADRSAEDPRNWGDHVDESSQVYKDWKKGRVYGYHLYEKHTCTECNETHKTMIDSCYGFYGIEYQDSMNEYLSAHGVQLKGGTKKRLEPIQ